MSSRPDREDQDFRRDFGDALSHLRDARGPCPSADTLDQFHQGRLSAEARDAVARHVAFCGACDLALERLQSFENAADPRPGLAARLGAFFRSPLPAYALLVLALYPAWRGLFPRPQPAPAPSQPAESSARPTRVFDLTATRDLAAPVVDAAPDAVFVLSFFVPVRPGQHYYASVADEAGKTIQAPVEIARPDPSGTLYLVCPRERFTPGRYLVRVTASDGARHEFPFTFR